MKRRRLADDPPEINLIPMLDMISLLIQLLLINAQFGTYAEVATAMGSPSGEPQPGLQLRVDLSLEGFEVSWNASDGPQTRSLPCLDGGCLDETGPRLDAYDTRSLTGIVRELKALQPDENSAQLMMSPEVPFQVMALTMDALRGSNEPNATLFPEIVMGSRGAR